MLAAGRPGISQRNSRSAHKLFHSARSPLACYSLATTRSHAITSERVVTPDALPSHVRMLQRYAQGTHCPSGQAVAAIETLPPTTATPHFSAGHTGTQRRNPPETPPGPDLSKKHPRRPRRDSGDAALCRRCQRRNPTETPPTPDLCDPRTKCIRAQVSRGTSAVLDKHFNSARSQAMPSKQNATQARPHLSNQQCSKD